MLVACPAALARPSARNGILAVQPTRGAGIELVGEDGRHAHRICTSTELCGHPVAPRFAPDGRGLVFTDRSSGRVGVVAPDGTCLWCLATRPLSARGSGAAFAGDRALTVVARGSRALERISLAGARTKVIVRGRVSAAESSPGRRLALERGGWIVVAGRRLVRGGAPAWSPDGRALAFTRGGWVWRIAVTGRSARARRLVRGFAPVWSPDGRRIALIGTGRRVVTIPAGGGRARAVGRVRGRSVSWQALPARRDPCQSGRGTVVARSSTAVVREYGHDAGLVTGPTVTGCLEVTGQTRTVLDRPSGDVAPVVKLRRTAGRYVAFELFTGQQSEAGCSNGISVHNLGAPTPTSGREVDTTDDPGCPGGAGTLALNSLGDAAWTSRTDTEGHHDLTGISCPTTSLCVAVSGQHQAAYVSTDPLSDTASWQAMSLPGTTNGLSGVSCPTATFCLATADGGVEVTNDPTGGAGAWSFVAVGGSDLLLSSPSCASASLCAVAASGPNVAVFTSTDPSQASSWTGSTIATRSAIEVSDLSCPTTTFCAATTYGDHAVHVSTDPSDPAPTWTTTTLTPPGIGPHLDAISCPTADRCVALGSGGGDGPDVAEVTSQPTAGASAWTAQPTSAPPGSSISCLTSGPCLASGTGGGGLGAPASAANPDPFSGTAWTALTQTVGGSPSCVSTAFCALASAGDVLASATPFSGPYSTTRVDGAPCWTADTSCTQEKLTLADGSGTHIVDRSAVGAASPIADVRFNASGTTLTWRHGATPQSLPTR